MREVVRRELIDGILDGRRPPGDPVRLAETAEAMGSSLTPVREALIELEREGFVVSRPHRGFVVRPFDPEEIRCLYPVIAALEIAGLREAPPEPSDFATLIALNDELRAAADPADRSALDRRWHEALLARSRNRILHEELDRLKRRALRYELAYMREAARAARSRDQHAEIVAALRRNDLGRAAAALEENWLIGPRTLIPWLEARAATEEL